MTLHPDAKRFLDQLRLSNAPATGELPPNEARELTDRNAPALFGPTDPVANVEDRKIHGPASEIGIRIYQPAQPQSPTGSPCTLFFHGGGWVTGSLTSHDGVCRALAARTPCTVLSVEYRLAPENKFPAAVEDAWAAVLWVVENAAALGVDPARVAVAGDSSGGNLAAVVAIRARDHRTRLAHQLLIYPVTNFDFTTHSYRENADGYWLTKEGMRWFWAQYLPSEAAGSNPEASPLLASDLSGLAPATVTTAEYDPLRDEGKAYADRLQAAGVPVTYRCYEGMIHGFYRLAGEIGNAHQALDEAAESLRTAFEGAYPATR